MINFKALDLHPFRDFFIGDDSNLTTSTAYKKVAWFRRGIDLRGDAVTRVPYAVMRGETEIATETNPPQNAMLNIDAILNDIAHDLDLFGAFYAIYETNDFGRNGKWRRFHPKTIEPQYSRETGELLDFKRALNGKVTRFEPDDLLYIWMPNHEAEIGNGIGVGTTVLQNATGLDFLNQFSTKFFENGAINPTIVQIEGYEMLPEDEQGRIRTQLKRLMGGIKNAFNILPLSGGGTTVQNLMQNLNDMAMGELAARHREDIATGLGIPQSLLFSNASTFATAQQDDFHFYDKTITPFISMIADQLNERLFEAENLTLVFQPERLEVMQRYEYEQSEKLNGMLDRGVITIAEYREMMGLPELEDIPEAEPDMEQSNIIPFPQVSNDDIVDEIRTWQTMSKKRYKEGTPAKALDFDTAIIPLHIYSTIAFDLAMAKSVDDVQTIFDRNIQALQSIS